MQTFGAIFCVLAIIQLGVLVVSSIQRAADGRKQSRLSAERLREQIRAAGVLRNQREQARLCWNGVRKFVVDRKVTEADNVCSFHMVPHDGKPLPLFRPGQFLTFRMRMPESEKAVVRCYSISGHPSPGKYRITIKRVPPPPGSSGVPAGLVSNHFHDRVQEGDILDVEAPRGKFFIDPLLQRPVVLVAGGVGITPFVSMIETIAEVGSGREVILFYGVHEPKDAAFADELIVLANTHDNIAVHMCYSGYQGNGSDLPDGHFLQQVDLDLLQRVLGTSNYDFWLCGPPPMMESLIAGLQQWGVPKERIFTEAFGAATGKAVSRVKLAAGKPQQSSETSSPPTPTRYQVRFSKSNKLSEWDESDGSLLEFARKNGVPIESGCEIGNCGTCVVAIKSGCTVCTSDQGAETDEGTCLTCISIPQGDLVLDA